MAITRNIQDYYKNVQNNNPYALSTDTQAIKSVYDQATAAAQAVEERAIMNAENAWQRNLASTQATALDTIRKNNASAIATGASKGMQAANELSAVLGLQDTAVEESTALAQQRLDLADAYAAEYAKNAVTAQEMANTNKQAMMSQAMQQYGYDTELEAQRLLSASEIMSSIYQNDRMGLAVLSEQIRGTNPAMANWIDSYLASGNMWNTPKPPTGTDSGSILDSILDALSGGAAGITGSTGSTGATGATNSAPTYRKNDETGMLEYSTDGGTTWNNTGVKIGKDENINNEANNKNKETVTKSFERQELQDRINTLKSEGKTDTEEYQKLLELSKQIQTPWTREGTNNAYTRYEKILAEETGFNNFEWSLNKDKKDTTVNVWDYDGKFTAPIYDTEGRTIGHLEKAANQKAAPIARKLLEDKAAGIAVWDPDTQRYYTKGTRGNVYILRMDSTYIYDKLPKSVKDRDFSVTYSNIK